MKDRNVNSPIHHQMVLKKQLVGLVVLFLFCLAALFPAFQLIKTDVQLTDILALSGLCCLLCFSFVKARYCNVFYNSIFVIWLLIIFLGLLLGIVSNYDYFEKFYFPSEMWQYVKRMAYFAVAYYYSRGKIVTSKQFFKILILTLLIIEFVGIIQIFNSSLGSILSAVYARTLYQLIHLVERSYATKRVFGVAGFSSAWGAFSVFAFCVSVASCFLKIKKRDSNSLWVIISTLVVVISLLNIWFAGSRGAILALLCVIVVLFLYFLLIAWKYNKNFVKIPSIFFLLSVFVWCYFHFFDQGRLDSIIYRFDVLHLTSGGGRVDQILQALSLLTGPYELIFGVGNLVQRTYGVSFGTESEPFFLLVNYGLTGLFLRYLLLLYIIKHAFGILRKYPYGYEYQLALATIISIIGYSIFSMTYFFFHELYVGTMPWLLFGWVHGLPQNPLSVSLKPVFGSRRYNEEGCVF